VQGRTAKEAGMTTPGEVKVFRPHGGEQEADDLRDVLEAQFAGQTDRLIQLTSRYRFSRDDAVAASIVSARLSLADTAHALQRIAEGRYGACAHCGLKIPRWRLLEQPHSSLCPRCDRFDAEPSRSGRYQSM
jgi:RNA polymerase-binding transcription factor DksA